MLNGYIEWWRTTLCITRVYHPRSRLYLPCPFPCLLWTALPSLMVLWWVSFYYYVSLQFKSLLARLSCCFIIGQIDYNIYWLLTSAILYIKQFLAFLFCLFCRGRGKRGSGNVAWVRLECDSSISASRVLGLQTGTLCLTKRKYILMIFVNCIMCQTWTRRKGSWNARGKRHFKFLEW